MTPDETQPEIPRDTPTLPDAGAAQFLSAPAGATGNKPPRRPVVDWVPQGYEILGPIGQGGMGVVYRARQRDLDRVVALKVLIAGEDASPQMLARFQREAQAAAKLSHPNIVQVYEVGQEGARHYFTMEHVAGPSLQDLLHGEPLPSRRAAEIARKVASALAYAHARGVIHRDVKPSNILIDPAGEPRLADFGLARDISNPGLTAPGASLGTPAYASPEQVNGDTASVDARSDVYSLGATLYEMLTGRPPFTGETAFALIVQTLSADPVPPRVANPKVHADLETVCLKAMEKDPARRYASMEALAGDLGRYLEGEAIEARPLSSAERLWRKARKHRAVVLPSAAALLLALAFVAWLGVSSLRRSNDVRAGLSEAARQEAVAEAASGKARREAYVAARDSLLAVRRLDKTNDLAATALVRVERRLAEIAQEEEREREKGAEAEGVLAKAPLVSAVLRRFAEASEPLAHMEALSYGEALAPEERSARVAAFWPAIQRFIEETPEDSASRATMWPLAGWAARLAGREEAEEWMKKGSALDPQIPYGALMRAMAAFSEYVDDQPLPATSITDTGVKFGAPPAETARMAKARERMVGLLEEASGARLWGKSDAEAYRSALEGIRAEQAGDFATAEARLTEAVASPELRPLATALLFARAKVRYLRKEFASARTDIEQVKAARPGQAQAWTSSAMIHEGEGAERAPKGEDPREEFKKAIADYDQALHADARMWSAIVNRGNARLILAEAERSRGGDARGGYRASIADYTEVLDRHPELASNWVHRGMTRMCLADAEAERGGDPRATYRGAIADLGEALKREPAGGDAVDAYGYRGSAYQGLGEAEDLRGEDPRDDYRRSIADCEAAIKLDPKQSQPWLHRATTYDCLGKAEESRGGDPRESFRKAIADSGEALAREPQSVVIWNNRGNAYEDLAEAEATREVDPRTSFGHAIEDCTEAVKRNPSYAPAYNNRGNAHQGLAAAADRRGEDPRAEIGKAIADFDLALKADPSLAPAWSNRGTGWQTLGEAEKARGGDPHEDFAKAIADFGAALARNPDYLDAYNNRGNTYMALVGEDEARGADASANCERAIHDYDAVLAIDPGHWIAHANKGLLLEGRKELAKAIAEYEAALKVVGDGYPALKGWLARAKKAQGGKPAWVAACEKGAEAIARGDYAAARGPYEEGVAGAGAEVDAAGKPALANAHYNLACIYALASAGRSGPKAEAKPVAAEEASRAREVAFRHLRAAIDLGNNDLDALSKDEDLTPLHDDPGWSELLRRLQKR